jgi:hypothetical protein
MRIDSSGNVGIGTTSPSTALDVAGTVTTDGLIVDGSASITGSLSMPASSTEARTIEIGLGRTGNGNSYIDLIGDTTYTDYGARFIRTSGGANAETSIEHRGTGGLALTAVDAGFLKFSTSNTERVRIDSAGNLLVGTTATARTADGFRYIESTNVARFTSTGNQSMEINRTDASGGAAVIFYTADTGVGSISVTASATAYNTSSDYRLKENITDAPAGNIDAIKVRSFDWKADGSHQDYGMVAQELEAVAPYAVTKGETEDDMWSVDYSKLVPMLIKEIQDLKAEVAALKGA